MKQIPLTQNQFTTVDDHWYDYLNQWKWHARWDKTTHSYYAMRTVNGKKVLMHRIIANTPDGMLCDHIHHNTLDNRECELRNVTPSQSVMNRRKQINNKTGVIGITRRNRSNKYRASLFCDGKMVLDKEFTNIEDAIQARLEAQRKYFGEFSLLQEVPETS